MTRTLVLLLPIASFFSADLDCRGGVRPGAVDLAVVPTGRGLAIGVRVGQGPVGAILAGAGAEGMRGTEVDVGIAEVGVYPEVVAFAVVLRAAGVRAVWVGCDGRVVEVGGRVRSGATHARPSAVAVSPPARPWPRRASSGVGMPWPDFIRAPGWDPASAAAAAG